MDRFDTIEAASAALRSGATTAEELTRAALDRIAANAPLNAVAACDPDLALAEARDRDRSSPAGPLHGIPVTIKDMFATEGLPTCAGTRAQLPPLPGGDAEAVARLRAAGAVILAKTNMHEIALGLTGENPVTGDVCNPHDPARQAGGSSSGSGVAVATGIGLASLGTDTGGSIRVPAALCGVVGFKPSFGLVPVAGCVPLSPTCDHVGPLARTVRDARIVAEVLSGHPLGGTVDRPRFGIPRAYLAGRLGTDMRAAFEALVARLPDAVEVAADGMEQTIAAYAPMARAEAAYTHRDTLERAPETFSDMVRTGLEWGRDVPSGAYLAARDARRQVRAGVAAALEHVDVLLLPATPMQAVPRGTVTVELESGEGAHRDAQLALTAPFNLAGVPVVVLPFATADGLPLGIQVVARHGEDARALAAAEWLERFL